MLFSSIGKLRAFPAEQGKDVGWGGGGRGEREGGWKENWALGWGHGAQIATICLTCLQNKCYQNTKHTEKDRGQSV